jgi:hypothetical protein
MHLPNRVAPDGSLHEHPARGMLTGNRGIVHDPDTRKPNGRRWSTISWICCALTWKGRRREVWGRNRTGPRGATAGWSELFFLDEVSALAAGHRPCFACRREAAETFLACFDAANGLSGRDIRARDRLLHASRRLSSKHAPQRLSAIDLPGLPDGTIVQGGGKFLALKDRRALPWDFSGYGSPASLGELARGPVELVTPRPAMLALRAGYKPQWHLSAEV